MDQRELFVQKFCPTFSGLITLALCVFPAPATAVMIVFFISKSCRSIKHLTASFYFLSSADEPFKHPYLDRHFENFAFHVSV